MFKIKSKHVSETEYITILKIKFEDDWREIHKGTVVFSHHWNLANSSYLNIWDKCHAFTCTWDNLPPKCFSLSLSQPIFKAHHVSSLIHEHTFLCTT
jgi:hypothetical protein